MGNVRLIKKSELKYLKDYGTMIEAAYSRVYHEEYKPMRISSLVQLGRDLAKQQGGWGGYDYVTGQHILDWIFWGKFKRGLCWTAAAAAVVAGVYLHYSAINSNGLESGHPDEPPRVRTEHRETATVEQRIDELMS